MEHKVKLRLGSELTVYFEREIDSVGPGRCDICCCQSTDLSRIEVRIGEILNGYEEADLVDRASATMFVLMATVGGGFRFCLKCLEQRLEQSRVQLASLSGSPDADESAFGRYVINLLRQGYLQRN